MRAKALLAGLGAAVAMHAVVATPAHACAGCRNPALAVTRGGEGALEAGATRASAALTGTTVHVVHEAGCRDLGACEEVPAQPTFFHDQNLYPAELRLSGEYGLDRVWGIEAQLPLRVIRTTIKYTDQSGAPYEPLDPDIHHRNETIFGVADPWILVRAGTTLDHWWVAARAGASLPLGRTEANPFALGDRGLRHQHIQLGSGTFDPVGVVEASRLFGAVQLQLFTQAHVPVYENEHGYRAPWRIYGGGSVGHSIAGDVSGSFGLEGSHEAAERWDGHMRQDGNLGRSEVLVAAALRYRAGATELSLSARAPVWRHIVIGDEPPGTLSSPLILSLSATHVFGKGSSDARLARHQ